MATTPITDDIKRQVLAEATSVTPNYSVDPNDERFAQATDPVDQSKAEYNQLMDGMVEGADSFYNSLKENAQQWADKQSELQQERTDFTIEQIEQEKEQANKDYLKEQSGAYADWQKQSNQYGAAAEKMAAAGLTGTGYSESSKVSMYNTYQNRVATARESYNKAVLNYNNAIKDAQLQNNAALAEIAYNALQQQLELSLQGFQYKNQLILEQANKNIEFDNTKWNRWQQIYDNIMEENKLAENVRQFESNQAFQAEQAEINRKFEAAQAELDRQHDLALVKANTQKEKELADYNYELAMKKLAQEQKNALAILDKELANDKALATHNNSLKNSSVITGGGNGNNVSTKTGTKTAAQKQAEVNKIIANNKNNTNNATKTLDYNTAVDLMTKAGVPNERASAIKSSNEWTRTSNNSWDKQAYSSYAEYLQGVTQLLINEYRK